MCASTNVLSWRPFDPPRPPPPGAFKFPWCLLSTACFIIQYDLGSFDQDLEKEVNTYLESWGGATSRVPSTAGGAGDGGSDASAGSRDADGTGNNASVGGGMTLEGGAAAVGRDSTADGSTAGSRWLGSDISAVGTLVVLVTGLCR